MAANNSWGRRVFFAMLAATLLIAVMTLPGLAAPPKTMKFQVNSTGPTTPDFAGAVNTAPASTSNVSFWIRATNTSPGPGNPNSLRVTAPTSPSPGFVITGAEVNNANSSRTSNPTVIIGPFGAYVDLNLIAPLQNGQYITVKISATTPAGCPSGVTSNEWAGVMFTGDTAGGGQSFSTGTDKTGTITTLTSSSCPTAPGPVSISSDPVASGGIVKFVNSTQVTLTASPNPVSGTPTPTVHWESSTASDCLTNTSAAFTDTGATGASYAFTAQTADKDKCFRAKADNGVDPPSTSNVIKLSLSTVTLEFVTDRAPTDAATNTDITGTAFDPDEPSVQVALKVDGSTSGAFDETNVTMTEDGPGSITQGGTAVLSGGLATFSGLQIDTAGDYNLTATVDGGGPSTGQVAVTITPAGVCPDRVSGQEDFTTTEFVGEPGEGTLNISGLTSNECLGLDVEFSLVDGFQQWSIEVNKLSVEDKLTGYATWTWDLPGTDPVPWTEIKWKHSNGVSLEETDFVPLPRCNADAVTDPMPDPTLPNPEYSALFPIVSTTLGDIPAGVCMFNSELTDSGNTYTETQQIAINEDPAGRKG
jgi:hypothetical protein